MQWFRKAIEQLSAETSWTYRTGGESYAEPAALTSLCLLGAGESSAATASAEWLSCIQSSDGSVGVSKSESTPGWPTGLALSVWVNWQLANGEDRFRQNIRLAVDWTLNNQGETLPQHDGIGHNTSLRGWSWALDTHAWLEPTAMFVLGLTHCGYAHHGLTLEAVRLVIDRQLPSGGFNYGNTSVLGQRLLPRIQPTGIALATLAVANVDLARVGRSLDYLQREWPNINSTASLSYAAIGLTSYGRTPASLDQKLQERYDIWRRRNGCTYKLALLALAAQEERCLLGRRELSNDGSSVSAEKR